MVLNPELTPVDLEEANLEQDHAPTAHLHLVEDPVVNIEELPLEDAYEDTLRGGDAVVDLETRGDEATERVKEHASIDAGGSLDQFLNQVGQYPLLTAAQEVQIAKQIEAGVQAENNLNEYITNSCGWLDQEVLENYANIAESGKAAKRRMIESNLRLVISIVKKYRFQGVPFLDLIQEGVIGLNRAAELFDYRLGFKFSTYATRWIHQSAQRALANKGSTIRIPVHVVQRGNKIERARRKLANKNGGNDPTIEELAKETRLSKQLVEQTLNAPKANVSLNREIGDDNEDSLLDIFPDENVPPVDEEVAQSEENEFIRRVIFAGLEQLTDRERRVLIIRYDLEGDGSNTKTLDEVGEILNLSRERIRNIETLALKKLASIEEIRALKPVRVPKNKTETEESQETELQTIADNFNIAIGSVLTESQSKIFILKHCMKVSKKEIAKKLDRAENTVKTYLSEIKYTLLEAGYTVDQAIEIARSIEGLSE